MGYTTEFYGSIEVKPFLSNKEIEFLKKFAGTRRMHRKNGPYYVEGKGYAGQENEPDILEFNTPPPGQPGLWCHWVPSEDGTYIEWDGGEKFYESASWMKYIIQHFLQPGSMASDVLPFLQGHMCNGEITAQGEENDDRWKLIVKDNEVLVAEAKAISFKKPRAI